LDTFKGLLDQLYSEITSEVDIKELDRSYLPLGYSFILQSLNQTCTLLTPTPSPFTEIHKACGFLNAQLVIPIPILQPNWVDTVKKSFSNQKRGKVEITGTPALVIFWIEEESTFEGEQVMEFRISEFIEGKLDVDPYYELISVVSFNREEKSFEIINKIEGTWIGLTNASEVIFQNLIN
jgi:hypothetical protein